MSLCNFVMFMDQNYVDELRHLIKKFSLTDIIHSLGEMYITTGKV